MGVDGNQEGKLVERIHEVIDYFRSEFEITYAETIGALEIVKLDMYLEMRRIAEEDDAHNG